jgi:hypothetical protein
MRGTALTVGLAYRLVCSGTQLEISVYALFDAGCSRAGGVRHQSEQVSAIVGTRIMGRLR